MKYDIITIGGAVRDFTFYVEKLKEKTSSTVCFLLGAKINIKEAYFTHGGGACNVAVGLSNFGLKVAAIARLGKDHSGQAILEKLKEKKVDTRFIQIDEKLHTSVSTIIQPRGGDRTILTYRGANENLKIDQYQKDLINSKLIYIAALDGDWQKTLTKIFNSKSKNQNLKIAWNPGMIQLKAGKKKLAPFLKKTEILIVNRKEAAILSGKDENIISLLLKSLAQLGPKIIVITCGSDGAYVMDKNGILYEASKSTKIIDTTGAGDSFSSGFLAGLILWRDLGKALKLGIINSAANLKIVGAQEGLLTKKDLKRLRL